MNVQQCISQISRLNKYTKSNLTIQFYNAYNERTFLFGVDLKKKKVAYFELLCDVLTNENILKIHLKD